MNESDSAHMMKTDQSEFQWITAYKKGDTGALEHLVEHFRRPLYAFIYNMLQGKGDAEEIFQEVWLRAIRNMERYRDKNFCGWLFRIAHNCMIDSIRKNQRKVDLGTTDETGEDPISRFASPDMSPDMEIADKDLGRRIRMAIAGLPEDQREVFLMRTEGELSFKEIAAIQQTSLNTALSRMQYALQKLRPMLEEDYRNIGRE
ncbi:MAG TPA: sigma-70 family RNA polymerase sigma factor [Kiritimatiellia bacterium]|nr:sigma-70 family RNA polymerase sigma factor [Kiritimatiellia bacterium]